MILCSASSPTPCSTSSWRTKHAHYAPPFTSRPFHRHDRRVLRVAQPGLLLRPDRSRRRLPAEDLLSARAACDRHAVRIRDRRPVRNRTSAYSRSTLGPALLCRHPHEPDLRGGGADHRLDLGARLMGPLVGLERAHARIVLDHHAAVRHIPAAALRDRGPRAPGALRVGVRDHRGRIRADELPCRAPVGLLSAPARARQLLQPARVDGAHVPRLDRGNRIAFRDAVLLRADRQAHPHPAQSPLTHSRLPTR